MTSRFPLVSPGIRAQAAIVVNLACAALGGGSVQGVPAACAVRQALQNAGLHRTPGGEFLVLLEPLLSQIKETFIDQGGNRYLYPLVLGGLLRGQRLVFGGTSTCPGRTVITPNTAGLMCLTKTGHATVGRVSEQPPDRRTLPAGGFHAGRDALFIQLTGNGSDTQRLAGV